MGFDGAVAGALQATRNGESFVVPLALPGDDVVPDRFITFWCYGSRGLYIHPDIWHGAIVPLADHAELLDRQGRVHARVPVDFANESAVTSPYRCDRPELEGQPRLSPATGSA